MFYKEIRGHAKAIERLEGVVKRGRVAHAYLFSGPEGVGKRLVARAFARTILDAPFPPDRYFEIEKPKDKQVIIIDQVRDLIRTLSFRHAQSRVVVVNDAELMNEESQNALLKTLEEPPAKTVILLVTAVPSMLLPTIRSRCQTVLFHPLPEAELETFLREKNLPEPEFLAAIAEGSLGRALALAPEIAEWRATATDFLEKALAGELNPIIEAITKIRDSEGQRDAARLTLGVAALALREALRAAAGAPVRLLVAPKSLTGSVDDLAAKIEAVLDHLRYIDLNANVGLAVEDALLRI